MRGALKEAESSIKTSPLTVMRGLNGLTRKIKSSFSDLKEDDMEDSTQVDE
jgi:hypothetical protein